MSSEQEQEVVWISHKEFADLVQEYNCLEQFSGIHTGKHTVNKFEIVINEVIGHKYDNVNVDFINCSPAERNKLRSAFTRIEKQIRKNCRRKKPWGFELDSAKAFISSEDYKTLFVYPTHPSTNER